MWRGHWLRLGQRSEPNGLQSLALSLKCARHANGGVAVTGLAMDGERAESVRGHYDECLLLLVLEWDVFWPMGPIGLAGATTRVRFVGRVGTRVISGVWGPPGALYGNSESIAAAQERGERWGGVFQLRPR